MWETTNKYGKKVKPIWPPKKPLWGEHLLHVQPKTTWSVVWKIWNNKSWFFMRFKILLCNFHALFNMWVWIIMLLCCRWLAISISKWLLVANFGWGSFTFNYQKSVLVLLIKTGYLYRLRKDYIIKVKS